MPALPLGLKGWLDLGDILSVKELLLDAVVYIGY